MVWQWVMMTWKMQAEVAVVEGCEILQLIHPCLPHASHSMHASVHTWVMWMVQMDIVEHVAALDAPLLLLGVFDARMFHVPSHPAVGWGERSWPAYVEVEIEGIAHSLEMMTLHVSAIGLGVERDVVDVGAIAFVAVLWLARAMIMMTIAMVWVSGIEPMVPTGMEKDETAVDGMAMGMGTAKPEEGMEMMMQVNGVTSMGMATVQCVRHYSCTEK